MSLLNGLLALGSLAFVVPLVIHLLYRNRFRVLDWGAMHLLAPVVRTNRRRMQWMNLILLLIRCAIPIVLAFCLARPILTGFRTIPGDAPRSIVLVIDDSQSMAARDPSGLTRFEQAADAAKEVLGSLTRRDEVIVIPTSQLATPPGVGGPREAVRKLDSIEPQSGPVSLEAMMRAAIAASTEALHAGVSLVLISDFAESTAGQFEPDSLIDLASGLADSANPPSVSLIAIGDRDPTQTPENVSVDEIRLLDPAVVAGRGFTVAARIENRSDKPIRDAEVIWTINGEPQSPRSLTLAPRSGTVIAARGKMDRPGVHEVSAHIRGQDSHPVDDTRRLGIDVIESIEVSILDGSVSRPSEGPDYVMGEADFVSIALSPFAFGGQGQRDAVRASIIDTKELKRRLAGDKKHPATEVLILAGVPSVPTAVRKTIGDFVEKGGHLVITDGDDVLPETYDAGFGTWSLPATLGEKITESAAIPQPTQVTPSYQPWEEIGDESGEVPLQLLQRRQWTIDDDAAHVLWRTPSDAPLAVTAKRGNGTVTQFAIAATDRWSTWPLRPAFLPMVQQLVLDLAGAGSSVNVLVGEEMLVDASGDGNDDPSEKTWRVTAPDGTNTTVDADDRSRLSMIATSPGRYRFASSPDSNGDEVSIVRVASLPASESDLRPISQSELTSMAETLGGEVHQTAADWNQQQTVARNGREIWRYLLAMVLILLIAELWWQQRGASRGHTAPIAPPRMAT